MEERFRRTAGRKVSHFIIGEEGRVGSRSAFTAAAVVSVASLTTMLLAAVPNAHAKFWCPGDPYVAGEQCDDWEYCCKLGCQPLPCN